jgi:hypothetical protein
MEYRPHFCVHNDNQERGKEEKAAAAVEVVGSNPSCSAYFEGISEVSKAEQKFTPNGT